MKKNIYSSIALLFIGISVWSQSPNWTVNENGFQYTMTFVAFINVDGNTLSNTNDSVAAFVNGECRGVTNLTYVSSEDKYYAYLTVFSNENEETINFKVYDSANDEVKEIEKTLKFEINEHHGNLFQAHSIANPTLNDKAEVLSIGFKDVISNDIEYDVSQITLFLNKDQNITNLNTEITLSSGAKLFVANVAQESGNNSMDFSNSIEFQVRSEDQSVVKIWVISVKRAEGIVTYYKKDAVCYTNGVIKLLYTENDLDAILTKDGATYATQTIHNGEVIFNNLEVGIYTVKVGGNVKEITINLKE